MAESDTKDSMGSPLFLLPDNNVPGARVEFKSAKELRSDHNRKMEQFKRVYNFKVGINYWLDQMAPASYKPFYLLKRAVLNDLQIGSSAQGKYIIVRLIEPGFETFFWNCLIEDEHGEVCDLQVFNYPSRELFDAGTVLIIKEPHLKILANGCPAIRCDSHSDIIVLRRSHHFYILTHSIVWKNWINYGERVATVERYVFNQPLTISPEDWVNLGDALRRRGWSKNHRLALECYLLASKKCSTKSVTYEQLQYGLCRVYFRLRYYEKTIAISKFIPNSKWAMLLVGRAYYKLRKYEEAKKVFESFMKRYPKHSITRCLSQCQLRVRQQNIGFNSIEQLQSERRENPSKTLNHTDCTGPVEVVPISGKGRGVVLTEDVDANTVLIISKAFVSSKRTMTATSLQFKRLYYDSCTDLKLISGIAHAVTRNPETFGPMIYDLSTASQHHEEVQLYCDPMTRSEPMCDIRIIEAIYRNNRFFIHDLCIGETVAVGSGLFIYPSYLNHSCEPNVCAFFYNNIMVVSSNRRMRAGEELLISYVPTCWPYEKRLPFFADRGFTCKCRRCILQI